MKSFYLLRVRTALNKSVRISTIALKGFAIQALMTTAIEFKLLAPRNLRASLIGSFSNWEEIPMEKGKDGYFRVWVDLEDGIYLYKFRIQSKSPVFEEDEWVEVNDPYITALEPDTQTGIVQIRGGQRVVDPYIWQADDHPLPSNEQLVIYELHVSDFTKGGFQQLVEKLDYLAELGVNAIELMPVNEYPGYSWGYKVRYFFAIKSSYGSTEALKRLVDVCHARGIRVIIDGIYNHSDEESPLLLIDRNYWYYPGLHYPDDPANYWGPEFNYDFYDETLDLRPAWAFIRDVVRFWIQEYHIDGIRYDAVRQLGNEEFLHWIAQEAKKVAGNKPFYNIAEHIPERPELTGETGPMDGCWHESFRIFALENISGQSFNPEQLKEILDPKQQGYRGTTTVINYLATHDRDHLMAEESFQKLDRIVAFERAKLGAVLLTTTVGVPLLWMGEEFGEATRQTPNQQNPLNWSLLEQKQNQDLRKFYQKLMALRTSHSALYTENIDIFYENKAAKLIAYSRWHGRENRVVVAINFSDNDLTQYCLEPFPGRGIWTDWLSERPVSVSETSLTIDLPARQALILVSPPLNQ